MIRCVRDLREEVVGISNEANKAVEKKVILVAEELEIETRKTIFSSTLRKMKPCPARIQLMKC